MTRDELVDEVVPLLPGSHDGSEHEHDPEVDCKPAADGPWTFRGSWYQARSPPAVIGLVTWMLFCMTLSGTVAVIPMGRMIESVICRRHYGTEEPVDELLCKTDAIQTELAWLGAGYVTINAVVGLIVSLPWGIISDRMGRKPIFRLSFVSVILGGTWSLIVLYRWDIFPVRLIWISPFFAMFGGGLPVTVAVIHSIIADVATERASAFMWTSLGAVVGGVSGPALSAKLMEQFGLWAPFGVSSVLLPIVFITTIFLPETLTKRLKGPSDDDSPTASGEPFFRAIRSHVRNGITHLLSSLSMLKHRSLTIIMFTFLLHPSIEMSHNQTLAQTISKRFHWTLAQTGYIFSLRGILTVTVLALLPMMSKYLTSRRRLSTFGKDLLLMQTSLACLIVGNVLTGTESFPVLAVGQAIGTLGIGFASLEKALAAAYVGKEETSRLYALTGMVETLGSFIAAPSLAWAFATGVKAGGAWMGLPFWYVAGLSVIALVAVCFVRRPVGGIGREEGSADGDGQDIEV